MPEIRTYRYYSGGKWRAVASGRVFDLHEIAMQGGGVAQTGREDEDHERDIDLADP